MLARDLVNEPANTLGPVEFAAEAKALEKLGVKVEILDEKEMKKLGMGSLLGVAQGSQRGRRAWSSCSGTAARPRTSRSPSSARASSSTPAAISIKPAAGMEDMKGDMGGAAAVTGLMHALAARKAKANVVGIIGLVENMPSTAMRSVPATSSPPCPARPIEVHQHRRRGPPRAGRRALVLQRPLQAEIHGQSGDADRRHHRRARPATMPACSPTMTNWPNGCSPPGKSTQERLWRMPLGAEYDKMIDSKNADMKNIGGRYGGSITAAQFLQRFVNDTPWAHLDIAGTAMGSPANEINQSWGSGFGVRLLDRLVRDHYEG